MNRTRSTTRVLRLLVPLLLIGGTTLVEGAAVASTYWNGTIDPHDSVLVAIVVSDANGTTLISGKPTVWLRPDAPRLDPADLTGPIKATLAGHRVGDAYTIGPLGPMGVWNGTVSIPRIRGPFPDVVTLPRSLLPANTNVTVGHVIQLNDPVSADVRIVSATPTNVTYTPTFSTPAWPFNRLPGNATILNGTAGNYSLRIDLPLGRAFAWTRSCGNKLYVLKPGSYRVLGLNATSVSLGYSSLPYPELVGREVVFHVQILQRSRWATDTADAVWDAAVK